ncbi:hypothetical protein BU16DRAFT_310222 [Lophium mytilinum]|uniref:Uncharacterized protein n=1 Tax=Lophium mytilinum TaxID=390894 RepID=A0A6A6R2M4_9PEZI|nr:hypothetical protein BU16DRAFT_310222 [Lophium mytilinum]
MIDHLVNFPCLYRTVTSSIMVLGRVLVHTPRPCLRPTQKQPSRSLCLAIFTLVVRLGASYLVSTSKFRQNPLLQNITIRRYKIEST